MPGIEGFYNFVSTNYNRNKILIESFAQKNKKMQDYCNQVGKKKLFWEFRTDFRER